MFKLKPIRSCKSAFKLTSNKFSPQQIYTRTFLQSNNRTKIFRKHLSSSSSSPSSLFQSLNCEHERISRCNNSKNIGTFVQKEPSLTNMYLEDPLLQSYLKKHIPTSILKQIEDDLIEFGQKVATDIYNVCLECEKNPPQLLRHDAWGKRIDKIITSMAWKQMHSISAEEGLISIAYERKHAEFSRIYQMVKLLLFSSASGLYSCPLAMTDGAARIAEMNKEDNLNLQEAFRHLTSRDPLEFWTSGQWMTERRGGSDVAASTETIARKEEREDFYRLFGNKWFTSATDANIAFTLARIVGKHGQIPQGSSGLTMFYVVVKNDKGELNNIEIVNLKNKLGTRQMPTAELMLKGTKAYKVSIEGKGISSISTMLTITRIHNSISAVSFMRRIVNLASSYASQRVAFGNLLKDHSLHVKTLAKLEMETRGMSILVLFLTKLLGLQEVGKSSKQDDDLLRILTPITKLYTGKQAVAVVSEGLECFGGQGYIEDTGLPQILRDVQVLPIWEGTTNILSLDVLRCIKTSHGSILRSLQQSIWSLLSETLPDPQRKLSEAREKILISTEEIIKTVMNYPDFLVPGARDLAFSIARVYICALLINHASHLDATESDVMTAFYWSQMELTPFVDGVKRCAYERKTCKAEHDLVFNKLIPLTMEMDNEVENQMASQH